MVWAVFLNTTTSAGIEHPDGKGLGILIADFIAGPELELYVGNDTVANFFFVQIPGSKQSVTFRNEAIFRGLAFNDLGQVQATMGMATADVNGDNRLDIFATNFYSDANTLYIQSEDEFFREQTRQANLYDASFNMLGFGTQFIDADGSGRLEILVTNGHVDRSFATGEPDAMSPQLFRDSGNGRFQEIPSTEIGEYFEEKMLGRSLVLWDYNNDGRHDFAVSHLDRHAAVVTNQTDSSANYFMLSLVGTASSRRPIGTQVILHLDNSETRHQQLSAGHGYEASNDYRLLFGLGQNKIQSVEIHWPSGEIQTVKSVQENKHWIIIEDGPLLELMN